MDAPATTWRGRLQRQLRRQRVDAPRHALLGAALSALLLLVVHGGGTLLGADEAIAADDAGAHDGTALFSATMVGDIMFARHVERVAERRGYASLLAEVAPLLPADYVSGNLERVVSERDDLPDADKVIHLAGEPAGLDALADAGFTLLSLSNNHTMDHGLPGLEDTIAAVEAAGLEHVGAGADLDAAMEIHYGEHNGLTVASLSFTDAYVQGFIARAFQGGVLDAEPDTFGPLLQRASAQADFVIAHFHWGEEYDFGPNGRQRELAELAAEAGADIIVGHHPHVLMPAEMIGDTLVLYSLGNFVFDQGWSRTRESAIARYHLAEDGRARLELIPVYIREATPRVAAGASGAYRRARIFQRLRGQGLDWRVEDGMLVTEFEHGIGAGT
jgi:gamma-polyglutamate biosynthesis protein CapA